MASRGYNPPWEAPPSSRRVANWSENRLGRPPYRSRPDTPRSLNAGEPPLAPKRKVSPMSKKNTKTADFHIRMTPEERANIDEVAEKCGLTRSQLIRLLAQLPTDEIRGSNVRLVFIDRKEVARIHREMRRFGTNLNQATHSLNSISYYLRNGKLRYE